MATVFHSPAYGSAVSRHVWSVESYHRMAKAGLLNYDRDVKLGLYARHGVPEVWLLDVDRNELLVHREPADGHYRQMRRLSATDTATAATAPEISVRLADLIG